MQVVIGLLLALTVATTSFADPVLMDTNSYIEALVGDGKETAPSAKERLVLTAIEDLVRQGLTASPDVAEAQAKVLAATERADAVSRRFEPVITGESRASHSTTADLTMDSRSQSLTRSFGINVTQNLWRGGQDDLRVDAALGLASLAETDLKLARARLSFQIKTAAYRLNHAATRLAIAESTLTGASRLLSMTEDKQRAGLVGQIDVVQAEVSLSRSKAALQKAKSDLLLVKEDLLGLVQVRETDIADTIDSLISNPIRFYDSRSTEQVLQSKNASLMVQKAKQSEANAELDVQKARRGRYMPSLDAFADANRSFADSKTRYDDSALAALDQDRNSTSVSFGIGLTVPLWNPALGGDINVAVANKVVADRALEVAVQKEFFRYQRLHNELIALAANLRPSFESYLLAKQLHESQLKLYSSGAVDLFSVVEADRTRLDALSLWLSELQTLQLGLLRAEAAVAGFLPD